MTNERAGLPHVDLHYEEDADIPPGRHRRDSQYIFRRVVGAVTAEAVAGGPSRVLDVGCGFGQQLLLLRSQGCETWGLDASAALLRYCQRQLDLRAASAVLVHGLAERLPFRSASFDRVVCQGSLDHFARPEVFLAEVARILKPDGRAIITLANYESLSCLLGRALYRAKERLQLPLSKERPYWQTPANHTFRGSLAALRRLATPSLELERCYGVSLLWLFTRWSLLLEALPAGTAWALLRAADRLAYRAPALADTIVSVWRPRPASAPERAPAQENHDARRAHAGLR